MLDVLEHIKNDEEFIKQAKRLLKLNGFYLINVPAKMKLFDNDDIYYGHYRRYEKEDLIRLLENNGFEITILVL